MDPLNALAYAKFAPVASELCALPPQPNEIRLHTCTIALAIGPLAADWQACRQLMLGPSSVGRKSVAHFLSVHLQASIGCEGAAN